ncbi:MAG: glycosyltransferase family 2 protein [Phycisphaerae bacterium]|nr:glycosyltransferase family 2 protein [Phycisphaerae bacterium]
MALECSIVIPLCNEEQSLPTLHLRLSAVMQRLAIPYEIIYVDDGSRDRTAEIIHDLFLQDPAVKGVFLSRNFGHQAALCAGLEAATGRSVITMDGDLQDPPEVIPDLIDKWRSGYQVVFARRRSRRENILKKAAYFSFYRLLRQVSEIAIPLDTGDFALMDRRALDEMNNLPERTRFLRGLRSWVGFRQAEVEYDRDPRHTGQTKYTFRRLLRLAMDGILSFSDAPLKAVTVTGCLMCLAALVVLALSVSGLWSVAGAAGMLTLGAAMGLLGGIQLIGLGVVGEYMSRIYREVRGRPMYVAKERIGFQRMPRPVPDVLDFLGTEVRQYRDRITAARLSPSTSMETPVRDSSA